MKVPQKSIKELRQKKKLTKKLPELTSTKKSLSSLLQKKIRVLIRGNRYIVREVERRQPQGTLQ